jgi:hypothetical protein
MKARVKVGWIEELPEEPAEEAAEVTDAATEEGTA